MSRWAPSFACKLCRHVHTAPSDAVFMVNREDCSDLGEPERLRCEERQKAELHHFTLDTGQLRNLRIILDKLNSEGTVTAHTLIEYEWARLLRDVFKE